MEELLKSLIDIQQRLDAPKTQTNNFGHFNYRSLEDIEAAIKPLLREHQCGIRFSDEVVDRCGRTFLKTTLMFFNTKGQSLTTTAEAEISEEKAGMDSAQITGAASSYARKYAMNAMFAIDDTKDADSNEYYKKKSGETKPATQKRTYTRRSTSTPVASSPQPRDRYTGIRQAVSSCQSQNELMDLYYQHQQEVEGNQEIKNLFTVRKQQLNQFSRVA